MILNNIHKSSINEANVVDVINENNFTLTITNMDESTDIYKYNNEQLMLEDIRKINHSKNLVLCG